MPGYRHRILKDHPVIYLPMDEELGVLRDIAGGTGATSAGSTPTYGRPPIPGDPLGGGIKFSGSHWFDAKPMAAILSRFEAEQDYTVEAWISERTTGAWEMVFAVNTSSRGNRFLFGVAGSIHLIAHSGNSAASGTPSITDGNPHHLVWRYKDGVFQIYVDGVGSDGSFWPRAIADGANFSVSDYYSIGQEWDSGTASNLLNGTLSHLAFYDYALTEEQIVAHYQAGLASAFGPIQVSTDLDLAGSKLVVLTNSENDFIDHATLGEGENGYTANVALEEGEEVHLLARMPDLSLLKSGGVPIQEPAAAFTMSPVGPGGGGEGDGSVHRLAGTVSIDGDPASRSVVVISDDPAGRQVVGEGASDGGGVFDLQYYGWSGPVVALAIDRYGENFAPLADLFVGDRVHPSAPNGYVYEVTVAGTTGESEPTWSIAANVQSGSVTFTPKPYYRPVASGPLQGEVHVSPEPVEQPIKLLAMVEEYGRLIHEDELSVGKPATENFSNLWFVADVEPVALDAPGVFVWQVDLADGYSQPKNSFMGVSTTTWTTDTTPDQADSYQSLLVYPSGLNLYVRTSKQPFYYLGGGTEPNTGATITFVLDMDSKSFFIYQGNTLLHSDQDIFTASSEDAWRPVLCVRSALSTVGLQQLRAVFDPVDFVNLPSTLDDDFPGWQRWTGRMVAPD